MKNEFYLLALKWIIMDDGMYPTFSCKINLISSLIELPGNSQLSYGIALSPFVALIFGYKWNLLVFDGSSLKLQLLAFYVKSLSEAFRALLRK